VKIEILGVDKTSILEAGSLNITRISKERRSCSFNLFSAASSWLPSAGQDLKIYDDSDNLIFGGVIRRVGIEPFDSGNSADTKVLSSIYSDGYKMLTDKRVVYVDGTDMYAKDMVEILLTEIADEKITAGTIDNGAFFDSYSKTLAPASDQIDDLAKASGFKWYIDDTKQLHFVQESSTPDAAHSLMSTGSFYDYHNFRVNKTLEDYRNTQYVLGDRSSSDGFTQEGFAESTAQIAIRQAIEGGSCYSSGIYESVISDTNIKNEADAESVALNALKQYGLPDGISFNSFQTDWQPSTKLQVKLPKYGIDDITYYLIEEVTLRKTTANELVAEIVATKRDPDDFSSQKSDDDIDFISRIGKGEAFYEESVNSLKQGITYQGVKISAEEGFISTTIIDGLELQVVANAIDGFVLKQDDVIVGRFTVIDGKARLLTSTIADPLSCSNSYISFEDDPELGGYDALRFYTTDGSTGYIEPLRIKHFSWGSYIMRFPVVDDKGWLYIQARGSTGFPANSSIRLAGGDGSGGIVITSDSGTSNNTSIEMTPTSIVFSKNGVPVETW